MMKTVTLRKEQIYQGDLLLVNARHPYRDNSRKFYVSLNSRYEETLLSREAANALQLIFQKISSGNAIVPVSGYRTLEEQVNIYNTSLKDNGEEFTRKYVALPNHSEHQTGLAIDLGLNKPDIDLTVLISRMAVFEKNLGRQHPITDLLSAMPRIKKV